MPESEKPPKTLETPAPEPEAAKPEELAATATTVAETPETKPGTDYSGVIGGVFIRLLILGALAYCFSRTTGARALR
jgi:hypothetical protein